MKRYAFTLIELVVSITLFGLISILLFGTIDNLRHQLAFSKEKGELIDHKTRILSLMQSDFDRPKDLNISVATKEFSLASIGGSNHSLYSIPHPYVVWVVLKNEHTLVRLESSYPITLPLRDDSIFVTHSDIIGESCELFRIYESSKKRLIYLKFENQSPFVVETAK